MCDSLLPRNTAGCVYCCQITKRCNTRSLHSRFAQDDRTRVAAILRQVPSETWGYSKGNNLQQAFGDDAMGVTQIEE
jgi:hypothetical protein